MKHPIRSALSLLLCILLLCPLVGLFAACDRGAPAEKNAITSVIPEEDTLLINAVLTKGFLNSYTEKKVYLFELTAEKSSNVDLSELDPVAEVKAAESIRFKLPVLDGMRTRQYSSFLVASYDAKTKQYTALTSPMAVSDGNGSAPSAEGSIKGLISDHPADAVRLGISHTVVNVNMDELILSGWKRDAVAYVFNGVTRYLDGEALAALDETVGIYTAAGVHVYLRFVLGSPDGSDVPAGLYFPMGDKAPESVRYYAVNMTSAFSSDVMEGFFDFMAGRFAAASEDTPPATSFIIGHQVNRPSVNNYAGGAELVDYVTNYEKLVRLANTAMKTHAPGGRVYVALDDRRAVNNGDGWDLSTFLSTFREECALRGDYGWQVSCELHASSSAVWEEDSTADAAYYTIRNLGTLTDLLNSPMYRIGGAEGEARRLVISGYAIPAVAAGSVPTGTDANRQAASYAFSYMTCVQNGHVEALIYSQHADAAVNAAEQPLCGLWTVKAASFETPEGVVLRLFPAQKRALYDVFHRIDTTEAKSLSSGLTSIIGAPYTKLESALAGNAHPVTAVTGAATLGGYEAEHKRANPLFTFNGGSLHGFSDAGNLTYLELAEAESLGTVTLHARFDTVAVCDPMGVTTSLPATDLIGSKQVLLDLYAGPLQNTSSEAKPTVTLRLIRSAKGAVSAGDGELLYEASVTDVSASTWQTASFDVSEFTKLLDADDTVTLSVLVHYPDGSSWSGASNLGLAGIHVVGGTATSGSSTGLLLAVVIILVLLAAGGLTFLLMRRRR